MTRTPEAQPGLTLLSSVPAAARAVMREVRGGRGFTARVVALGFTPGAEVTVIQNFGRGPILVEVRQSRVALGRGEALKMWVEVLPEA
mgnify:CR=1 FL=1